MTIYPIRVAQLHEYVNFTGRSPGNGMMERICEDGLAAARFIREMSGEPYAFASDFLPGLWDNLTTCIERGVVSSNDGERVIQINTHTYVSYPCDSQLGDLVISHRPSLFRPDQTREWVFYLENYWPHFPDTLVAALRGTPVDPESEPDETPPTQTHYDIHVGPLSRWVARPAEDAHRDLESYGARDGSMRDFWPLADYMYERATAGNREGMPQGVSQVFFGFWDSLAEVLSRHEPLPRSEYSTALSCTRIDDDVHVSYFPDRNLIVVDLRDDQENITSWNLHTEWFTIPPTVRVLLEREPVVQPSAEQLRTWRADIRGILSANPIRDTVNRDISHAIPMPGLWAFLDGPVEARRNLEEFGLNDEVLRNWWSLGQHLMTVASGGEDDSWDRPQLTRQLFWDTLATVISQGEDIPPPATLATGPLPLAIITELADHETIVSLLEAHNAIVIRRRRDGGSIAWVLELEGFALPDNIRLLLSTNASRVQMPDAAAMMEEAELTPDQEEELREINSADLDDQLNEALFDQLARRDPEAEQRASDAVTEFTRSRLNEQSFVERLFPPLAAVDPPTHIRMLGQNGRHYEVELPAGVGYHNIASVVDAEGNVMFTVDGVPTAHMEVADTPPDRPLPPNAGSLMYDALHGPVIRSGQDLPMLPGVHMFRRMLQLGFVTSHISIAGEIQTVTQTRDGTVINYYSDSGLIVGWSINRRSWHFDTRQFIVPGEIIDLLSRDRQPAEQANQEIGSQGIGTQGIGNQEPRPAGTRVAGITADLNGDLFDVLVDNTNQVVGRVPHRGAVDPVLRTPIEAARFQSERMNAAVRARLRQPFQAVLPSSSADTGPPRRVITPAITNE